MWSQEGPADPCRSALLGTGCFQENGCLEELLLLLASGKISSKVNPLAVCKNIHLLPLAEVKNDLIIATAVER